MNHGVLRVEVLKTQILFILDRARKVGLLTYVDYNLYYALSPEIPGGGVESNPHLHVYDKKYPILDRVYMGEEVWYVVFLNIQY